MSFSHHIVGFNFNLFNILYNKHDVKLLDLLKDDNFRFLNKYFSNNATPFYYIECYKLVKCLLNEMLYIVENEKVY